MLNFRCIVQFSHCKSNIANRKLSFVNLKSSFAPLFFVILQFLISSPNLDPSRYHIADF